MLLAAHAALALIITGEQRIFREIAVNKNKSAPLPVTIRDSAAAPAVSMSRFPF